ncbi:PREDICTED: protein SAWADEE HOMEODOMAIN HOMOLOG 2 isoform X2 [Nelumbo nucifera]|nr:PREDICTED: protein SAWADEE HOMEODOMAIN HOMOLOG 2 isoform X2 [Nelumbo nucifera]
MEACLQEVNNTIPSREVLLTLAEKFSASPERAGKIVVQPKQVWNWFQNRRYAQRAKSIKTPGKLSVSPMPRDDTVPVRNIPQPVTVPAGRSSSDGNTHMEFEAKSARDGAWYDVATFISHRMFETGDPEVRVRFAGFGAEEDEWVNVRRNVRQRSLPCEASECVAVLPGDLILCFQEGKEQALYFDAHVLDAQRRRHDVRGCRCRFLVRYDHDQSEEIVPLRKVCRRPETDYRLQQLHAMKESASADLRNVGKDPSLVSTSRDINSAAQLARKQRKPEENTDEMVAATLSQAKDPVTTNAITMDIKKSQNGPENIVGTSDIPMGDATTTVATVASTGTGTGPAGPCSGTIEKIQEGR